ncbi:hypothetical protein BDF22DRAFT_657655 [Syncephalis plumigaleata]|nr:hypothetical protein BDF22DRAFT_657655 [Syncephalis plumigaleata]
MTGMNIQASANNDKEAMVTGEKPYRRLLGVVCCVVRIQHSQLPFVFKNTNPHRRRCRCHYFRVKNNGTNKLAPEVKYKQPKTPVKLMEATFRLMHTRGTSIQYNVIQDSALDDREQPLFDCFLMRCLNTRTAIRGVALEETIMAASQIDPRLMELLESDNTTNEQHIAMNDTDTNMDMTLSMKHPARNMPILRNMILCALSPAIRLSSNAWCSLLEWTAFRTPPMLTRLLEKAYRDGFVLSGALGERLLVGSTLREPYSLPVIYQLYEATIKAEGRPDQRSVSRLLHLLLQSVHRMSVIIDISRQSTCTTSVEVQIKGTVVNRLSIQR